MKYLFFSPMAWNHYRHRNIELTIGLSELGNECTYVNPVKYKNWRNGALRLQNSSSHPSNSIKVIEHFSGLSLSPLLVLYENFDNVRMIRKQQPEVVVSWDPYMSLFSCIYCKLRNIPFVFDIMDDWAEMNNNNFARIFFKYIVKPLLSRFSYAITATSHKQVEEYSKHNKRVFLVPNGKPVDFIKKAGEYLNLCENESRVVNFIGTLRDWYDFDLLFEVFKQFPELQLNIYGQGELSEYLKSKSSQYSNILLKENADSEILPKLCAVSLFGILPLKLNKLNDSTCPIKLFDYWSAKKAVIASPTYELKKTGGNGGILFASTKEEYINAIKLLLNDSLKRKSEGEKGYQNMLTKYNYDIIPKQFVDSLALSK